MSELTAARARDRCGRTRVVTTRHDASRSEQQPLPATTTMEGLRMHTIFGLRIQLFPHNMDKQLYTTTSPRRKIFDAVHWYQGTED